MTSELVVSRVSFFDTRAPRRKLNHRVRTHNRIKGFSAATTKLPCMIEILLVNGFDSLTRVLSSRARFCCKSLIFIRISVALS